MKKRQAQFQKFMEELLPEHLDELLKETLDNAVASAKDASGNLTVDRAKLEAAAREALASLDRDKLERWARDAVHNVEPAKLEKWARSSLAAVDAEHLKQMLQDTLGNLDRAQLDALLKEGMRHIDRRKLEARLHERIRSLDLDKVKTSAAAALADFDLSPVERFINDRVDSVVRARLDTISAEELEQLAAAKRATMPRAQDEVVVAAKDGNAIGSFFGTLGRLTFLGAAGWIAYSHLFLEHQIPLPKAVAAELFTLVNRASGPVNIYQDRTAGGRPLVLIHSINAAASAYEMRPLFQHFRGKRPVFALDLPGFGFSARNAIEYTAEIYVKSIITMLEGISSGPADVIALSLSSEFTTEAARRRPELFNSLTLISPSGMMQRGETNTAQFANAFGFDGMAYPILSFRLWARPFYDLLTTRRSLQWYLQKSFVGDVPDGMVNYAYSTAHQPGAEHAPLYFVAGRLFTTNALDRIYRQVATPTLVLYDRDPYVRFDRLPELLAANPAWQSKRIGPTLGLPHWEKPEATIEALEEFWANVQEPAITA